jgi:DNA-directed RNA polymerase specialized sigma24 family protein
MSISSRIGPHLPYLRRFGRAITGQQDSGDALVVAVLESYIRTPGSIPVDADPRLALYRSLLGIWTATDGGAARVERTLDVTPSGRRITALTPLPRQAFLLTAVEGFTLQETAYILDQPESAVQALIDQAGREIARQMATDVLIIEDEPLIALDLESLVENLGHRVLGIARTQAEAVAAVQASKPGLILADIQLADGSSGIDAVNEILLSVNVPIIFITAFPERLLTGERPEPAFLIAKPFEINTVRAVISQALFFEMQAHAAPVKA